MGEADIALRTLVREFPEKLTHALMPGIVFERVESVETQLTARERRLDGAVRVTVGGEEQILHVEFQVGFTRDLPYRIFEYHIMLAQALYRGPGEGLPPISSTVILLKGPVRRPERRQEFATSPPDQPFSGVRFTLEAVYDWTMEELAARKGLLWTVFSPLTVDADANKLKVVLSMLEERVPVRDDLGELAAAMTVMAGLDARKRGLHEVIMAQIGKELIMQTQICEELAQVFDARGFERGLDRGLEQGREQGLEQGREEELRKSIFRMFGRRLGRKLNDREEAILIDRLKELGPDRLTDIVLGAADADAVESWLQGPA